MHTVGHAGLHSGPHLAGLYASGDYDLLQDYANANELYHQAGEIGCGLAYYNSAVALGNIIVYDNH